MDRVKKLVEMLRDNPDDSFLQHALALEHLKMGEEESARQLFENVLKNDPLYTGSYYHLALLYIRTGEKELALQTFEKGMEACRQTGDKHALSELRMAYDDFAEE